MKTPPSHAVPAPADKEPDPGAPASQEELREAAELRDALGDPSRAHDAATFARALVLAHSPRPLDASENEALVLRALGTADAAFASIAVARARRARRNLFAGAASALALAAAVMVLGRAAPEPVAALDAPAPLRVRSSQPLFHEPFAAHGGTSARIDRIAAARAGDLRENMFARWDVR